jgi:two-component system chemotaxis sensor kinase CheA
LESSLLRLEAEPANRELLNTIFVDAYHQGRVGVSGVRADRPLVPSAGESAGLFREGSLEADKIAVDLLIDARDRIGDLVSQVEVSGQESAEIDDLVDRAAAIAVRPDAGRGDLGAGSRRWFTREKRMRSCSTFSWSS